MHLGCGEWRDHFYLCSPSGALQWVLLLFMTTAKMKKKNPITNICFWPKISQKQAVTWAGIKITLPDNCLLIITFLFLPNWLLIWGAFNNHFVSPSLNLLHTCTFPSASAALLLIHCIETPLNWTKGVCLCCVTPDNRLLGHFPDSSWLTLSQAVTPLCGCI